MNILDTIVAVKQKSLQTSKKKLSLENLMSQCRTLKEVPSLIRSIRFPGEVSVIAEMKKSSPSAGLLMEEYHPIQLADCYEKAGARGISVLTEENFFQGSLAHLQEVKQVTRLPLLRKDFIFDPYQIYESKLQGASCVLLIAAILDEKTFSDLMDLCQELRVESLVEIHDEAELERVLKKNPALIGINNRSLKNLTVNLETTFKLREKIPSNICVVSESGIQSPESIRALRKSGTQAVLIGESILRSSNPLQTLKTFVEAGKN